MKCRLIAAGTRLPDWINEGFREYQKRLRQPLTLELVEDAGRAAPAGENRRNAPWPARARPCWRRIGREDHVVALEVGGAALAPTPS